MDVAFNRSFLRDVKRVRDPRLKRRIRKTIERLEAAATLDEIPHLKKLRGSQGCFRIALGDHRLGLKLEGERLVLVRCLARKDLYISIRGRT